MGAVGDIVEVKLSPREVVDDTSAATGLEDDSEATETESLEGEAGLGGEEEGGAVAREVVRCSDVVRDAALAAEVSEPACTAEIRAAEADVVVGSAKVEVRGAAADEAEVAVAAEAETAGTAVAEAAGMEEAGAVGVA